MLIESFKELDQLENCSAILGNLVLMFPALDSDNRLDYTSDQINKRVFSQLNEITGYFGIVSLTHLDSLGNMFPNLRVIRGRRLVQNYALFIYESDLLEV